MPTRTLLILLILIAGPSLPALAHGDHESRWSRPLAASCTGCHGTAGNAQDAMPRLAGQNRQQLIDQMQAFKTGKRPATVMHQLAKGYSDAQIELIADYFARQK